MNSNEKQPGPPLSNTSSSSVETDARPVTAEAEKALAKFVAAAKRIELGKYLDWSSAGGVDNCKHGYGAGIPCPRCDRETVKTFTAPSVSSGVGAGPIPEPGDVVP